MSDRARILAQLAEHGRPMSASAIAEALAYPPDDRAVPGILADLLARRLVRPLAPPGARRIRGAAILYEPTERGRLEAAGGAQLRIDGAPDRAPVHVQPALF